MKDKRNPVDFNDEENSIRQKSVLGNEPSGEHFTGHGHTVADLRGQVLEQVKSKDPFILRAREAMLIQKFDTYRRGLNKEP
jgi:hypothetical protein